MKQTWSDSKLCRIEERMKETEEIRQRVTQEERGKIDKIRNREIQGNIISTSISSYSFLPVRSYNETSSKYVNDVDRED